MDVFKVLAKGFLRPAIIPNSAAPPTAADDAGMPTSDSGLFQINLILTSDFADFAGVPDPVPAPSFAAVTDPSIGGLPTIPTSAPSIAYTKWYRVWERTSPRDFYQEAFILPFILVIVAVHVWGRRTNKRKARAWLDAHAPALEKEFAVVGYDGRLSSVSDNAQAMAADKLFIPSGLLREKTAQEYTTYATGRQNVTFVDIKVSLFKRYNPFTLMIEWLLSLFFESMKAPTERMEANSYAFDGKEKDLVPAPSRGDQESLTRGISSTYDGFVWAVVNKDTMRQLREERYDLSLTITKDNPKLPNWASVMSESAEITDLLLTSELIKAVEEAGDQLFDHLIVTDQPVDKPLK